MAKAKAKVKKVAYTAINASDMDKAIKSIKSRGTSLKTFVHQTAVGFLMHYAKHGDMSKAMALADAVAVAYTKGTRTAFIEWCVKYSTLKWDEENKVLYHKKGEKAGYDAECETVTLFEMVRDNSKPFDYLAGVMSLVKRARSGVEKGQVKVEQFKHLLAFAKSEGVDISEIEIPTPPTPEAANNQANAASEAA